MMNLKQGPFIVGVYRIKVCMVDYPVSPGFYRALSSHDDAEGGGKYGLLLHNLGGV